MSNTLTKQGILDGLNGVDNMLDKICTDTTHPSYTDKKSTLAIFRQKLLTFKGDANSSVLEGIFMDLCTYVTWLDDEVESGDEMWVDDKVLDELEESEDKEN